MDPASLSACWQTLSVENQHLSPQIDRRLAWPAVTGSLSGQLLSDVATRLGQVAPNLPCRHDGRADQPHR